MIDEDLKLDIRSYHPCCVQMSSKTALYYVPPVCPVSGGLQSTSLHPTALDKIRHLEAPRVDPQQETAPTFGNPTFTQHLNNLEVVEKGTVVFEARVEPAKDPTMKIGKAPNLSVATQT